MFINTALDCFGALFVLASGISISIYKPSLCGTCSVVVQCIHWEMCDGLIAKFVVSRCAFCKLRRILGFSIPSIIWANLLADTCLLVIGAFRSTLFLFLWWPCFGQWSTSFLRRFSELSHSCLLHWKNKAMSVSCPRQKFHSSSRFSFAFLEQSKVILSFVFAGQAERVRCIVICINSTPLKRVTEQKNPFEVCKRVARYNEFGYNTRLQIINITTT